MKDRSESSVISAAGPGMEELFERCRRQSFNRSNPEVFVRVAHESSGCRGNRVAKECLKVWPMVAYISSTSMHFAITRSWMPSFVFPWNVISAPLAVLVRVRGD